MISAKIELFCAAFLLFVWLVSVSEALHRVSGGRLRRIEAKNRELAARLEGWLRKREEHSLAIKTVNLFLISLMGATAFSMIPERFDPATLGVPAIAAAAAAMFLFIVIAEIIAGFILFKFDVPLLSVSMPLVALIRSTVMAPTLRLVLRLRDTVERRRPGSVSGLSSAEDEIMSLVEDSVVSGGRGQAINDEEKRMIRGVFNLNDTLAREIMTPRVDLFALPVSTPAAAAKAELIRTGHSRIPVYGSNIDEIKGVILAKDFLEEDNLRGKTAGEISHKPLFVPETKPVSELLNELRKTKNHFAVIIDEYGGTSGIVTLEDIIEEIVGEIGDEYDSEEDAKAKITQLSDGSWLLDGRTLLSEAAAALKIPIPDKNDADTVSGHVCAELGRIPEPGEEAPFSPSLRAIISKADKRRIISLKLQPVPQ
jgi:CBS domain containing-hemolysin-like protein